MLMVGVLIIMDFTNNLQNLTFNTSLLSLPVRFLDRYLAMHILFQDVAGQPHGLGRPGIGSRERDEIPPANLDRGYVGPQQQASGLPQHLAILL